MKLRLITFFLGSVIPFLAYSQAVYQVNKQYPVHPLNEHLAMVADTTASFTPQQILTDTSVSFSSRSDFARFLDSRITYWAKITLQAFDSLPGWTLHFEDRKFGMPAWGLSNGKVDVYAYADDELLFHRRSGIDYSEKERDVPDRWFVNQVSMGDLPLGQAVTLVIRAEGNSLGYPPFFQLSLRAPDHQHYHPLFEFHTSFNIFMFGVTFIIFLYHLLQFIYLKQRIFLWFSVWLLFSMLTQAMAVGLLLNSLAQLRFPVWMVISNGMFYSFWYFGRAFINSKEKFPMLDKIILALSLLMFIEITATVLYILLFDVQPVFLRIGIHYKMVIVYALISLVLSVILTLKKDPFARYFGFGAIIISLAFAIGGMWVEALIVPPIDPFAWGMFLQIIIYSFGIAYRQQRLSLNAYEEKLAAERSLAEMQRIQEIDEIKSRFFANISHELRTPLTLISGPLAAAAKQNGQFQEQGAVPLSQKHFSLIQKNTQRLQTLVDQLLDLSKIENGKISLTLMQGGMIRFIRSLVFSFESIAERKSINFLTTFPDEIDDAFYDKDKLEKIVTNVLSNAFKYTPEGGTVNVQLKQEAQFLSIKVSDTGKGIKPEDIDRIFERFYRVEGSEERGSGIGLALTKELVDLHRGTIEVNSQKGVGTTFHVNLPITLAALPASISLGNTDVMTEKPAEVLRDFKPNGPIHATNGTEATEKAQPLVLVVEDNEDLREFISDILRPTYRVITASNGLQGERMAFEHIPDVVISDVMMPKKDGYELCHALKKNTKTSHVPIIMLTAKAGKVNIIEGLTQGADVYLTKPFEADELLLRIRNLIETRKRIWEHFKALDMLLIDGLEVSSVEDQFLQKVMVVIKKNLDNERFSVDDIAREVGFSRSQLHRKLKALTDKSAQQLIAENRLNEAYRRLENKVGSVSEVAYAVGYTNMSYFAKAFKDKFGRLPSKI
jgi:signal transduction histidine kinase/DNA-binding response OmpR family regulator